MKQREIKFRAFDDGIMINSHNNVINNDIQQLSWFFNKVRPDAIIMQYTGLKDCKGVEIYEGDICKCVYENSEGGGFYSLEKEKGIVEYNLQWGYRFELKNGQQRILSLASIRFNTYEVIGNIYENPELLK